MFFFNITLKVSSKLFFLQISTVVVILDFFSKAAGRQLRRVTTEPIRRAEWAVQADVMSLRPHKQQRCTTHCGGEMAWSFPHGAHLIHILLLRHLQAAVITNPSVSHPPSIAWSSFSSYFVPLVQTTKRLPFHTWIAAPSTEESIHIGFRVRNLDRYVM